MDAKFYQILDDIRDSLEGEVSPEQQKAICKALGEMYAHGIELGFHLGVRTENNRWQHSPLVQN